MAPRIKSYVKAIYQSFYDAKTACEARIDKLQRDVSKTISSISFCKDEIDSVQRTVNELEHKEDNLAEKERDKSKYLSDCEDLLRDKERSLGKARDKLSDAKKEQAIVMGVGAGVSLIPIVGWIVGPTMMVVSVTAMQDAVNSASSAVNSARSTRDTTSNDLLRIRSELSSIQEEVSSNKSKLKASKNKKQRKENDLARIKAQLKTETEMQENLNKVFTFISVAFGRSRCLKNSVKHFYSIDQLANPMKELANHFIHAENRTYFTIKRDFSSEMKKLESVNNHVSITNSLQDYC